MVLPVDQVTGD